MENHRILTWRRWSAVRKAQVIGGVTGALATIAMPFLPGTITGRMSKFPNAISAHDGLTKESAG